jgi:hypothetical protein
MSYLITSYNSCCGPCCDSCCCSCKPSPIRPVGPIIKASSYVNIPVAPNGGTKTACVYYEGKRFPNDRVTLTVSTFNEFKIINGQKVAGPFDELTAAISNVTRKGFCVEFKNLSSETITVSFSWSAIQHTQ